MNRKSFVRYQLPVLVWMVAIFGLSTIPRFPQIQSPIGLDKIAHIVLWFVLCWLAMRAFQNQEKYPLFRTYALGAAVLLSIGYGVLDEIHQLYVPGRWADPYDAIADAVGALLFAGGHWVLQRRRAPSRAEKGETIDR